MFNLLPVGRCVCVFSLEQMEEMEKMPAATTTTQLLPIGAPVGLSEPQSLFLSSTKIFHKQRKNWQGRRNPNKPPAPEDIFKKDTETVMNPVTGEREEVQQDYNVVFRKVFAEFLKGVRFTHRNGLYRFNEPYGVDEYGSEEFEQAWLAENDDDDEVKLPQEKEMVDVQEQISLDERRLPPVANEAVDEEMAEPSFEPSSHLVSRRQFFINTFFQCSYCGERYGDWEEHSLVCRNDYIPPDRFEYYNYPPPPVEEPKKKKRKSVEVVCDMMDTASHCLCGRELNKPSMWGFREMCNQCYKKMYHPPAKARRTGK